MGGFGAFGKTPGLGDFFHFGLTRAFVSAWDGWLQAVIAEARESLGDGWRPRYLSAPIWRFTLAPGLAGPEGMQGVLMPSVDRVGRQFPLTLAAPVAGGRGGVELHVAAEATFAVLEEIALRTLAADAGLAALQGEVAGLSPASLGPPAEMTRRDGCLILRTQGGTLASALAALALPDGCRSPSVWSTVAEGESRLMIREGLPDPATARGFFDLDAPVWRGEAMQEVRA